MCGMLDPQLHSFYSDQHNTHQNQQVAIVDARRIFLVRAMSSSSLRTPQIPIDHTQKQLLFHPSSPAATVSWSPPSPSIHTTLLALGHSNGVSIYRQLPSPSENTLDRAEAFRKRYSFSKG